MAETSPLFIAQRLNIVVSFFCASIGRTCAKIGRVQPLQHCHVSQPFKNSHCCPTTLFACARTIAKVRSWSKTTPRAPRHDRTRPVTYDRTHHRICSPLCALYRLVNSVRRVSSRLAEPVSGHTQPSAFASGHLTGHVRSS
jgi:hypothetical protein